MSNLYLFNEDILVYSDNIEIAKEIFVEEGQTIDENTKIEKVGLDHVVYAFETFGIGGYDTVEFSQILKWYNLPTNIYLGNEDEIKRMYLE